MIDTKKIRESCHKATLTAKCLRRDARDLSDGLIAVGTDESLYCAADDVEHMINCISALIGELETVRKENVSLKAKIESKPLTCKGCENFSEDGFADICWGCRRNEEIPDYYSNSKKQTRHIKNG